jgi:hypothetical protein
MITFDRHARDLNGMLKSTNIELDYMTNKLRKLLDKSGSSSVPSSPKNKFSVQDNLSHYKDRFQNPVKSVVPSRPSPRHPAKELEHALTQKQFRTVNPFTESKLKDNLASENIFTSPKDYINSHGVKTNQNGNDRQDYLSYRPVESTYIKKFLNSNQENNFDLKTNSFYPEHSTRPNSQYRFPGEYPAKQKVSFLSKSPIVPKKSSRETILVIPYRLKEMKKKLQDIAWNTKNSFKKTKENYEKRRNSPNEKNESIHKKKSSFREIDKLTNLSSAKDKFFVIMRKDNISRDTSKGRTVTKNVYQKVSKCVTSSNIENVLKSYLQSGKIKMELNRGLGKI